MPPTIAVGDFEWDAEKADENRRRHRINFQEAATVFAHPGVAFFDDGSGEGIFKAVGISHRGRLLTVVYEPRDQRDRLISAWRSTREEQKLYLTRGA